MFVHFPANLQETDPLQMVTIATAFAKDGEDAIERLQDVWCGNGVGVPDDFEFEPWFYS